MIQFETVPWILIGFGNQEYQLSNKNVVPTNVDPLSMQKNPACVPNDRKYFCEVLDLTENFNYSGKF